MLRKEDNVKKRLLLIFTIITSVILLAACSQIEDQISKDEAEQLVIEERSGKIGMVEITSIEIKNNKYIIEWKNEENLEKGIDEVDKNGNVKMIDAQIE